MIVSPEVVNVILTAESKAIATNGPHGINVVPFSTVFVINNTIWLINYYFNKTAKNVQSDPSISLVCWKGFSGYQIKGSTEYLESGDLFDRAKRMVAEILPNRIVKGLLVITPTEVHDISLSPEQQK